MSQIQIDDFIAFAGQLEGQEVTTLAHKARFEVRVLTNGLEFTPLSTRKPRYHTRAYIERVLHEFDITGSWKAADYRFTLNATYMLALIHTYLSVPSPDALIQRIKSCLTPELLKPEYRKENRDNPTYGHCYAATEALYHLIRDSPLWSEYKPYWAKDDDDVTHWWLQNSKEDIIDPTEDQYLSVGKSPPYKNGRAGSFQMGRQTDDPSARAKKIIDCVADAEPDIDRNTNSR